LYNLSIIGGFPVVFDEEVHGIVLAVDGTQKVHEPILDAASLHATDHV
jgi:hypothetical protein